MILMLGLLPFFVLLISTLVLGNAGRNPREKITLFFYNPPDVEKDSASLLILVRVAFWMSLLPSAWIIGKTIGFL